MVEKRVFSLQVFFAFDSTFCFLASLHNEDMTPTFNCTGQASLQHLATRLNSCFTLHVLFVGMSAIVN
jgi:hypothetical protein